MLRSFFSSSGRLKVSFQVNIAMKASIVSAYNEGQLFSALEILAKTLVTLKPETLTDKMEASFNFFNLSILYFLF